MMIIAVHGTLLGQVAKRNVFVRLLDDWLMDTQIKLREYKVMETGGRFNQGGGGEVGVTIARLLKFNRYELEYLIEHDSSNVLFIENCVVAFQN